MSLNCTMAAPLPPLPSPPPFTTAGGGGKTPLSIIRCLEHNVCSLPEPVTAGRIRAPPVGTREAMLLWSAPPKRVLLVKKWRDPEATVAATEIADWLVEAFDVAICVWQDPADDDETSAFPTRFPRFDHRAACEDEVDVIITVGGDGTVLHVAALFQSAVPPVIAIAFGSLGFMTVHSLSSCQGVLTRVFGGCTHPQLLPTSFRTSEAAVPAPSGTTPQAAMVAVDGAGNVVASGVNGGAGAGRTTTGDSTAVTSSSSSTSALGVSAASEPGGNEAPTEAVSVSLRMRLLVDVYRRGATPGGPPLLSRVVLNELLLERGPSPYMATLNATVDGEPLTTVAADGLIVATQTGSTAYSLSAGGSILSPDTASIVFTPICPHTLSFRPLLFPDSAVLRLEVPPGARACAWASFDGRDSMQLEGGDFVVVSSSPWPLPLVCRGTALSDWIRAIKFKLYWNVREKQRAFKRPPLAVVGVAAGAAAATATTTAGATGGVDVEATSVGAAAVVAVGGGGAATDESTRSPSGAPAASASLRPSASATTALPELSLHPSPEPRAPAASPSVSDASRTHSSFEGDTPQMLLPAVVPVRAEQVSSSLASSSSSSASMSSSHLPASPHRHLNIGGGGGGGYAVAASSSNEGAGGAGGGGDGVTLRASRGRRRSSGGSADSTDSTAAARRLVAAVTAEARSSGGGAGRDASDGEDNDEYVDDAGDRVGAGGAAADGGGGGGGRHSSALAEGGRADDMTCDYNGGDDTADDDPEAALLCAVTRAAAAELANPPSTSSSSSTVTAAQAAPPLCITATPSSSPLRMLAHPGATPHVLSSPSGGAHGRSDGNVSARLLSPASHPHPHPSVHHHASETPPSSPVGVSTASLSSSSSALLLASNAALVSTVTAAVAAVSSAVSAANGVNSITSGPAPRYFIPKMGPLGAAGSTTPVVVGAAGGGNGFGNGGGAASSRTLQQQHQQQQPPASPAAAPSSAVRG